MPRISPDEKREKLLKERGKLDAQLRALDAQQKETQRKRDTRRKVIAGAIALEHLERNENDPFSVKLRELLHTYVDARSRDLFPFLPANNDRPAETTPAKGAINPAKDEIVTPAKPGPGKDKAEVAA